MRYVLDFKDQAEERVEVSFFYIGNGTFRMTIKDCGIGRVIDAHLGIKELKELNALSFKCRKEAEKKMHKESEKEAKNNFQRVCKEIEKGVKNG